MLDWYVWSTVNPSVRVNDFLSFAECKSRVYMDYIIEQFAVHVLFKWFQICVYILREMLCHWTYWWASATGLLYAYLFIFYFFVRTILHSTEVGLVHNHYLSKLDVLIALSVLLGPNFYKPYNILLWPIGHTTAINRNMHIITEFATIM